MIEKNCTDQLLYLPDAREVGLKQYQNNSHANTWVDYKEIFTKIILIDQIPCEVFTADYISLAVKHLGGQLTYFKPNKTEFWLAPEISSYSLFEKKKTKHHTSIIRNRSAFNDFVRSNIDNPEFRDKYVVFVNENFEAVGDSEVELVRKMRAKYGNIDMYVGKVSYEKTIYLIESPE